MIGVVILKIATGNQIFKLLKFLVFIRPDHLKMDETHGVVRKSKYGIVGAFRA